MEVTTFAGGLVTNPAEHASRGREAYAAFCRDCRSDKQGWLVRREGMTRLLDEAGITEVFAYRSVLLVVVNGRLKWTRLSDEDFIKAIIEPGSPRSVRASLLAAVASSAPRNIRVTLDESGATVSGTPQNVRVSRVEE